ncbi:MAG: hypothetical protein KL787_09340 [Taibaiella sp.]|nr:hypothetical protein [Taibaiella sp.]
MKHLIVFLFITAAMACLPPVANAQEHIMERHTVLIYGLPPEPVYTNAQNVVAGKWGLEFRAIAGCVVTEEFVDSVDRVNSKTYSILEQKYGKDWQDRFYKEVEEEYAKEQLVIRILKEDAGYQDLLERNGPESYPTFRLSPVMGTDQYDVRVSIVVHTGEKSTGYKYRVDYQSRSVQQR